MTETAEENAETRRTLRRAEKEKVKNTAVRVKEWLCHSELDYWDEQLKWGRRAILS